MKFCAVILAASQAYAAFTAPAQTNTNFTCDLDQNITFTWSSNSDEVAHIAKVGNCEDIPTGYVGSKGAWTYSLSVDGTCLTTVNDVDGNPTTAKDGTLELWYSAKKGIVINIGKTTQKLTCNLARTSSVNYTFGQISLLSETGTDAHDQAAGFTMTRYLDDMWDSPLPVTDNTVSSGDWVYFKIEGDGVADNYDWNPINCQVGVRDGQVYNPSYTLVDYYKLTGTSDAALCKETFLGTNVLTSAANDWYLKYTAFTFDKGDTVNVTVSCDIAVCPEGTHAGGAACDVDGKVWGDCMNPIDW